MSGGRQPDVLVLQVGDSAASVAGGISRVVRGHLARDLPGFRVEAQPSFDPQGRSFARRQRPALRAAARLLADGRVPRGSAILHVHVSKGLSHVREGSLALLGRLLGWRVVATWHASSGLPVSRIGRIALAGALRAAHVVTVLSPAHAAVVPVREDAVVVVPNDVPVPATVRDMASREPSVVFAGEVGTRKGADLLLRTWAALPQHLRSTWSLHVVGRITAELADVVAAVRDPSAHVHGLTPAPEVLDRLGRSSVAVLPSRAEALPMFLLEAMAAGCAVVGTDVGGVPYLLADGAGHLVPAGDEGALTATLTELLSSSALREVAARAGRARVADGFSTARLDVVWRELYASLTAQPVLDESSSRAAG